MQPRPIALAAVLALTVQLQSPAALAVPAGGGNQQLRLVEEEHDVILHERRTVARRRSWRADVITTRPAKVLSMYVAKGPLRLSEAEFLRELTRAGVGQEIVADVRARQEAARWHGGTALGLWGGAAVAGLVSAAQFGPNSPLVGPAGPNRVVIDTAGVAMIVLGVAGAVFTWLYMGDTAPRSAYFHEFTPAQASRAIDEFNKQR